MQKIANLRVEQLKTLLRERDKPTAGTKAELVQRLCEVENSDEINIDNNCTMQQQINELREMMQGITTLLQQQNRVQQPINIDNAHLIGQTAASVENTTTPVSMVDFSSARCSVKEIAETLPIFDPTNELSLPVEKFVERVNQAHSAYQWNEKSLMLAVFSKLKGVAKLWLDASPECYSNWTIFAERLVVEFGTKPNEAEIHYKMNSSVRKFDEKIVDYCFRMSAIGQRYNLSESAIIRYTRNGLRNRELQTAIAPMRFDSMRHLRETLDEYDKNRISTPGLKFEQNKNRNANNDGNKSSTENKSKIKCYNCFEEGHIATKCSKPLRKAQCGDGQKATMTNRRVECDDEFCMKVVYLKNQAIKAFVDTGSECSMIRKSCADKFEIETEPCVLKIKGICGGAQYASEMMKTEIKIDSVKVNVILYIVDDDLLTSDVLLGKEIFNRDIAANINSGQLKFEYLPVAENRETTVFERKIINENQIICGELESAQMGKLIRLLNEYNDIFANNTSEIGQTNALSMKIELDTNVSIAQNPYRIPEPKKVLVQQMIRELLVSGIIEPSESEYASPIVLVKKKNGESRLCVDYRKVNQHTRKEIYPMPHIEEQLHEAKRYKYFTVLDMNSGYYQIPIHPDSRRYTAFVTTEGLYQFKRMPFGLKNAPAVFQRLMAKVKERTQNGDMVNYMDDIMIGGLTVDEMLAKLRRVLDVLRELNLTLNLKKCEFAKETIEFLGHTLTPNGISPGTAKTIAITNFSIPKNVTEVRQFLGLSGYFRKFVAGYAIKSEPLRRLLCKEQNFRWGEEQQRAFDELKLALVSKPVMTSYRIEAKHEIHTDASSIGLAGVLLQLEEDDWKPVLYFSRSTSENEKRYHSYELETLAVVETLERFKYYVYGKEVTVITDCNAIKTAMAKKELIPRIARWWLKVQEYDIKIEHRSGKRMEHVDALSRSPVEASREVDEASLCVLKTGIDEEDWLFSMQIQDVDIKQIVDKLKLKDTKTLDEYIVENGRLYKKYEGAKLWVVPKALRSKVLYDCHNNAGHLGVDKTIQRLLSYLWFPRMRNYVKSYIKSCVECAYNKDRGGRKEGEYHFDDIEPIPFKTVHLDHLGPFPKSKQRNEHLLVLVDAFTKFTVIRAVKSTKAKPVLDIINEVSSYVGMPARIVTDRGTAFTSKEFTKYCNDNCIKHIKNAVRTPRANGHAERANRTILSMLLPTTTEDRCWDERLREIQWTINSMKNKTTTKTPQELLLGYSPRDVLQNKILLVIQDEQGAVNYTDLEEVRRNAAVKINEARQKAKLKYDNQHNKPTVYNVDDLVLVDNEPTSTGHSRKLEPHYKGPFIITASLGNDRYVVEDLPGSHRKQRHYSSVYASDKLKLWCTLPPCDDIEPYEDDLTRKPTEPERGRTSMSGEAECKHTPMATPKKTATSDGKN